MNRLVRGVVLLILLPAAGCASSSGIAPIDTVDAGDDTTTTPAPDTPPAIDANCDPALTYASFGKDFFATYCNRCHTWDQEAAQIYGSSIVDIAGTSTSMPPSTPFPTSDQRTQLVNWIGCGAP